MKLKNKKYIAIFCTLVVLVTSLSINFFLYNNNERYKSELLVIQKSISKTYNYLNSLTIRNFEKKVQSGDEFYVYIGRPDCGDCSLFEPILERTIEKYELYDKINYMNVKTFVEEDKTKWKEFKNKYNFTQTPAIIHFEEGKNIDIIEWDNEKGLSQNRLEDWLGNNNLVKKKN